MKQRSGRPQRFAVEDHLERSAEIGAICSYGRKKQDRGALRVDDGLPVTCCGSDVVSFADDVGSDVTATMSDVDLQSSSSTSEIAGPNSKSGDTHTKNKI
ncbi:hypothetical protein BaRGS_00031699 [Batillaria attramentaria]|uniref:Uncharacterized protein n=1 Tax=Batillaria attramentaria TaxID=370345 RepID=A0ABD0JPT4_9CAEN